MQKKIQIPPSMGDPRLPGPEYWFRCRWCNSPVFATVEEFCSQECEYRYTVWQYYHVQYEQEEG